MHDLGLLHNSHITVAGGVEDRGFFKAHAVGDTHQAGRDAGKRLAEDFHIVGEAAVHAIADALALRAG